MIDRIRTALLFAAAVTALLMTAISPAAAQELEPLTIADILPGECGPAPVIVGQYSDCRFPLARPVTLDPAGGPYLADVEGAHDEEVGLGLFRLAEQGLAERTRAGREGPGARVRGLSGDGQ